MTVDARCFISRRNDPLKLEAAGLLLCHAVPFAIAGSAYLAALAVIHVLAPRLEPLRLSEP